MRSIKKRLFKHFLFIIISTVIILEVILISFVKTYYCSNMEDFLKGQIKTSADFYNKYFSNSSLEDNVLNNVDAFWKQSNTQVQIIDLNGKVIMDSIGYIQKNEMTTSDYLKAKNGEFGSWIGKVPYDKKTVIAVSHPLKSNDEIVGVMRFVSSLSKVNNQLLMVFISFCLVGIVVSLISIITSLFLSRSIIAPIEYLTKDAQKMARGEFDFKSHNYSDDEIGKLAETFNYMAGEVLNRDKLKNDFISSVSHELRTPLTAIKGWANILNTTDGIDRSTTKEGLEIIEKESDRLTNMVEELLDFSKFVSGRITLKKEDSSLQEFAYYIESFMNPRALRDKITLKVSCEDGMPNVYIDKNRMKQVVLNILDNAFKFTEENGSITLKIYKEKQNIVMCITDTGIGISMDELPKVKEKFYKGKSSKSQNGIGLSICDEIIKLHNGTLDIESIEQEGTVVLISIPII
ncbi:MAG: HAMP domain-containing sensor histidine kinase [Clostridium sp.]